MLRLATPADFGFIRSLTGRPDYAPYLTDETEVALADYLDDPTTRLLIWESMGSAAGFALYCGLGQASDAVELRRIALDKAGGGQGATFFNALLDYAFSNLAAERVWLDASGENLRAMRVYERAGCLREGIQRAHWWRPALGRAVDLHLFGMLRAEWLKRRSEG